MVGKKQRLDLVGQYSPDWKAGRYLKFFRISEVPSNIAKRLLTGVPNVNPSDRQNNSPTMKEMVDLAAKHHGTLDGYIKVTPAGGYRQHYLRSGQLEPRQDSIIFDTVTLKMSDAEAERLAWRIKPDSLVNVGIDQYRFWWD